MRRAQKNGSKSIVIVKGGPGTGKSIIALNIMAEIAARQKTVLFVSKSKSFRDGLQSFVGGRATNMFVSPYSMTPSVMKENSLDVVLIDEAHRIEEKNVYRMMPASKRSDMPMLDQIIRTAKTSVFFIDNKQRVRASEIGTSDYIKFTASSYGYTVEEVELESQFRCMGSNN